MAGEVQLMNVLANTTGMTPRVLDFRPEAHTLRMQRLSGSALTREKLEALPVADQDALAKQMGRFIAKMHSSFPVQERELDIPWRAQALEKIDARLVAVTDGEERQRLLAAKNCVEHYGRTDGDFVMSHTDLHPDNVLFDDAKGTLGIIDFTAAKMAPRYRDFAKLRPSFSARFVNIAIEAYTEETGFEIDTAKVDAFRDVFDIMVAKEKTSALNPKLAPLAPDAPTGRAKGRRDIKRQLG